MRKQPRLAPLMSSHLLCLMVLRGQENEGGDVCPASAERSTTSRNWHFFDNLRAHVAFPVTSKAVGDSYSFILWDMNGGRNESLVVTTDTSSCRPSETHTRSIPQPHVVFSRDCPQVHSPVYKNAFEGCEFSISLAPCSLLRAPAHSYQCFPSTTRQPGYVLARAADVSRRLMTSTGYPEPMVP